MTKLITVGVFVLSQIADGRATADSPASTLNFSLKPDAESLGLTGEILTKKDCEKIASLGKLKDLKIGQDLEGCYVEPGGLEILSHSQSVKTMELWLVNPGDHDLGCLAACRNLRSLWIGSGPFIYDPSGRSQPATDDAYVPVLNVGLLRSISKIKSLTRLELYVPEEPVSGEILEPLLKSAELRVLCLHCKKLKGDALEKLSASKLKKTVIYSADAKVVIRPR